VQGRSAHSGPAPAGSEVLVKTFKQVLLCCTSALKDRQDNLLEYKEASCILELGPAVGWFARGSRIGPGPAIGDP